MAQQQREPITVPTGQGQRKVIGEKPVPGIYVPPPDRQPLGSIKEGMDRAMQPQEAMQTPEDEYLPYPLAAPSDWEQLRPTMRSTSTPINLRMVLEGLFKARGM